MDRYFAPALLQSAIAGFGKLACGGDAAFADIKDESSANNRLGRQPASLSERLAGIAHVA